MCLLRVFLFDFCFFMAGYLGNKKKTRTMESKMQLHLTVLTRVFELLPAVVTSNTNAKIAAVELVLATTRHLVFTTSFEAWVNAYQLLAVKCHLEFVQSTPHFDTALAPRVEAMLREISERLASLDSAPNPLATLYAHLCNIGACVQLAALGAPPQAVFGGACEVFKTCAEFCNELCTEFTGACDAHTAEVDFLVHCAAFNLATFSTLLVRFPPPLEIATMCEVKCTELKLAISSLMNTLEAPRTRVPLKRLNPAAKEFVPGNPPTTRQATQETQEKHEAQGEIHQAQESQEGEEPSSAVRLLEPLESSESPETPETPRTPETTVEAAAEANPEKAELEKVEPESQLTPPSEQSLKESIQHAVVEEGLGHVGAQEVSPDVAESKESPLEATVEEALEAHKSASEAQDAECEKSHQNEAPKQAEQAEETQEAQEAHPKPKKCKHKKAKRTKNAKKEEADPFEGFQREKPCTARRQEAEALDAVLKQHATITPAESRKTQEAIVFLACFLRQPDVCNNAKAWSALPEPCLFDEHAKDLKTFECSRDYAHLPVVLATQPIVAAFLVLRTMAPKLIGDVWTAVIHLMRCVHLTEAHAALGFVASRFSGPKALNFLCAHVYQPVMHFFNVGEVDVNRATLAVALLSRYSCPLNGKCLNFQCVVNQYHRMLKKFKQI
jgi:hypothetical protein